MPRYDYKNPAELLEDRSFETHIALKNAVHNEVLFGQIVRNVMKHSFECGVVSQGGDEPDGDYE